MSTYERIAELPVRDRVLRLRAAGDPTVARVRTADHGDPGKRRRPDRQRRGRHLRRPRPDRPRRTPARSTTSPGRATLGEFCELIGGLDLFPAAARARGLAATTGAGPSSPPRSTWRCAGRHRPCPRDLRPRAAAAELRRSMRLCAVPTAAPTIEHAPGQARASTRPAVQARPGKRLGRRADRRARRDRRGRLARPQGPVQGHAGRRRHRPGALPPAGRGLPRRLARGPRRQRRDPRRCSTRSRDRVTWDAPIHSLADIEALRAQAEGDQLKPSRFGRLQSTLRRLRLLRRARRHRRLRRRPVRARRRPRPDPVPRLALPPRHPERHRPARLQRPPCPAGPADQPDGGARRRLRHSA